MVAGEKRKDGGVAGFGAYDTWDIELDIVVVVKPSSFVLVRSNQKNDRCDFGFGVRWFFKYHTYVGT